MTKDGLLAIFGKSVGSQDPDPGGGVLFGRRMGRIGKSFVVEIMYQPDDAPVLGILAELSGHSPHRDLDGVHMFPERVGPRVFVDERESGGTIEHESTQ